MAAPPLPPWAAQSKRWWPSLHLLRRLAERHPEMWNDHVRLDDEERTSEIDFDAIVTVAWSWSWAEWRLARLARALHTHRHDIDVVELIEGLDEDEFQLALEAVAAAGPLP